MIAVKIIGLRIIFGIFFPCFGGGKRGVQMNVVVESPGRPLEGEEISSSSCPFQIIIYIGLSFLLIIIIISSSIIIFLFECACAWEIMHEFWIYLAAQNEFI